ncbi:uncharacterized protein LOC111053061 isoform X2 [Nilaparvata lugens]|uniref:uncharacterized protein LOC111053061 isoform X2 n=1 Tax=Nilaparvata lugens TaxID=108931 RepID=UPI00193EAE43|nr:uncharacterized protein LOC111053061 isoform X2 [Nilaparvata lugens]
MHKFVSSLFGFSAVVIFILQLHCNGVNAGVLTIQQPSSDIKGIEATIKLLPAEYPSNTKYVHEEVSCYPTKDPGYDACPRFKIENLSFSTDITNKWKLSVLHYYVCTTKAGKTGQDVFKFYQIRAIYDSATPVAKILYPDGETVTVEKKNIPDGYFSSKGYTARITFKYYRSYNFEARSEVKVATEAERCFSTLKRIETFLRNSMTEGRLSALAMLSIEKDLIMDIPDFIQKVIDQFAQLKDRRMDFLFK